MEEGEKVWSKVAALTVEKLKQYASMINSHAKIFVRVVDTRFRTSVLSGASIFQQFVFLDPCNMSRDEVALLKTTRFSLTEETSIESSWELVDDREIIELLRGTTSADKEATIL